MIWIGVDAHKRLHQGVALGVEGVQGEQTVPNTHEGWDQVLRWARQWPERSWAVAGAGSLGRGLAQFLVARGERVHEVSPRWTAQRRRTMRRPGKSDRLDAHAVAQLLREEVASLPRVVEEEPDAATVRLRSRLRDEIVGDLTRVRNRLHALLLCCDPEYRRHLPALTSPAGVGACQRYVAPGAGTLARAREQAVRQLAAQLALLARQERELRAALDRAVRTRFAPLTEIVGVGTVVAAGLIAEMGAPRPGFGDAQLAAMAGVAPLEASSAGGVRHRLNRHGNRRLNRLVHQVAVVQARCYAPARAYLQRRRHEGRTARESRRALKRYLIRRIWRQWHVCWLPATPTTGAPQLAA